MTEYDADHTGPDAAAAPRNGKVVTFYSYKGGTGRTMALANMAWILAANGKRVLVADWDLESPGLHRFFHPFIGASELENASGVVDLLGAFLRNLTNQRPRPEDWYVELAKVRQHAFALNWDHFPGQGRIDFLPAGQQDDTYGPSLATLPWDVFYSNGARGVDFLRALRDDMRHHYDYTLIDSRTGVSDVADVCTTHLPDVLVACFTLSEQGIAGASGRAAAIRSPRKPVRILPVPMRVDNAEQERANAGRTTAMERFAELPAGLSADERIRYWRDVEVPYQAFYAYEEILATIGDLPGTRTSISASYERLAGYITEGAVTALPPLEESLRLKTVARFLRSTARPLDPVALRYEPVDQVWAEWIGEVLKGVDVDVYDERDPDVPIPVGVRELFVVSPSSRERAMGIPAEQIGPLPRLGVYVGDIGSVPAFPLRTSAQLYRESETDAVDRLLQLVGYEGGVRPTTRFRYPGTASFVFNVPGQNPNFTGRDPDLRALRQYLLKNKQAALLQSSTPVALHGWGGIGKTQMAMEYAHRFRNAYDVVWWIGCDPAAFIDTAMSDLAKELGIAPSGSVPETNRAVLAALSRGEPHARWLLIFDNAASFEQLRPFLPKGGGEVLITSREPVWPAELRTVQVDVFQRKESVDHLLRRVGSGLTPQDAERVARALDDLPIAVSIAGAYLEQTGMSVDRYLQKIEEQGPSALSEGEVVSLPIEKTWDLLLEQLQERSKGASRLLQLCSVMAPDVALPLIYSDVMAGVLKAHDPSVADRHSRGALVQTMNQLALIKLDRASDQISVHRLLQHVIRQRMTEEEQSAARHQVHLVLAGSRPDQDADSPDSWPKFRMLWPHLDISGAPSCPDETVRTLMIDRVRYLWSRGTQRQGELLARQVVAAWNDLLPTLDSEDERRALRQQILHLQFNLANIMRDQARFADARRMDQQVLQAQETLLGPSHPHTLMTANGLAADLRALGQYRESLERDRETYNRWVEAFGEDHTRTLNALNNLASSHRLLGDYRAARRYDQQVHDRQRAVPNNDRHPITLRAAGNLGRDLREAGEYQASVNLLRGVAQDYARAFGADSRYALNASTNLAVSLRSAGAADEAAPLLQTAYERLTDSIGPDSPDTLACRLSWSLNLLSMGDTSRASAELSGVLEAYEKSLGPLHPHTLACVTNMSAVARAEQDSTRARALAETAAREIGGVLGHDHPYALAAAMNLAIVTAETGEMQQAAVQMARITDGLEQVLGPDHPDTVRGQANLALARRVRRGPVIAEEDISERLRVRLGANHPAVEAFGEHRYLHRVLDPHPF
jgi:tetratricopeptide (TPR) repeat protein